MLSTGSSAVPACFGPPQALKVQARSATSHARTAKPARPAGRTLGARPLRTDPFVELADHVLLGHDHASHMRGGVQSPLIEFAHPGIFGHDEVGEIDDISHVESWISQRLRGEEIFNL